MKINILSVENLCGKYQIEIDKYKTVKQIRSLIPDSWMKNIGNNFQFIYKNIILNDEKLISFYNLQENDEIKIGKLEKFLNNDDSIVELFIAGWNATFMHLIVNRNDNISTIKSIISRIIPEIVNIWNVDGIEMRNNQFVKEIDLIGGYYKLIIRDKSDDNDNQTFDNCCKIHDQYLWWYHGWKYIIPLGVFLAIFSHSQKLKVMERIRKLQSILSMNDRIAPRLNEDLSTLPLSFVSSRFIFCNCMVDRIMDICAEYWRTMIDHYFHGIEETMRNVFTLCLYSALLGYGTNRESAGKTVHKLFRTIVNEALGHFTKILNNKWDFTFCVLECFRSFVLEDYSNNNSDELIKDKLLNEVSFVTLKINKCKIDFYLSHKSIKTTNQLKKSISMQTNIPIQQIYLIPQFGGEQSNDVGLIDSMWQYSIEIMFDTENVEELELVGQGAFGTVHLCQDRITHKKFVLKKSIGSSENLYRDICNQYRFKPSSKINRYSGLFYDKNKIFVGMEYFPGGSLSSYIKKVGPLSEKEVMKISSQILIQIYEIHNSGIMHRDIKCDNVVFDEQMNAKLIDFGGSKFTMFSRVEDLLTKRQLYTPGTMFYMAPELINSQPYTDKIDIWSFGIMLVEMVTGKRPFYGCTPYQTVIKLRKYTKIEYESAQPISEELKQFIDSCLNTDQYERPNARQLLTSEFFRNYFIDTNNSQKFLYSFPEFLHLFPKFPTQPAEVFQKVIHMISHNVSNTKNDTSRFEQKFSEMFTQFTNLQNPNFEHKSEQFFENDARNSEINDDNNSQSDIFKYFSKVIGDFSEMLEK